MRLPRHVDPDAGPSRLPAAQTITWSLFAGAAVWLQGGLWWALAATAGCAVFFLAVPARPSRPRR